MIAHNSNLSCNRLIWPKRSEHLLSELKNTLPGTATAAIAHCSSDLRFHCSRPRLKTLHRIWRRSIETPTVSIHEWTKQLGEQSHNDRATEISKFFEKYLLYIMLLLGLGRPQHSIRETSLWLGLYIICHFCNFLVLFSTFYNAENSKNIGFG